MTKRLLLSILALTLCVSAQTYFNPKPISPRRIEIGNEGAIKLAEGGKAAFEVVVPAKLHKNVEEAGETLCLYLNKMLGSDVKVTRKASGTVPTFIVGDRSAAARLNLDLEHLDRDGYFIVTEGQNIVIIGNDAKNNHDNQRGTYFGVLEFLERFGGVRFYFPGEIGTFVPQKQDWTLPSINLTDRPDNQYRNVYLTELMKRQGKEFYPKTELDNRTFSNEYTKTLRYSTFNIPNCHGLAMLGYKDRFAKSHPEIFALKENGTRHDGSMITTPSDEDGQLCFTNDFLKEQVYLDAKAFLKCKGDSAAELKAAEERGVYWRGMKRHIWRPSNFIYPFFNIMPNDSNAKCFCENCSKIYAAGPQAISDHVWKFETDIARRLKDEGVEGYITVMAYSNYRMIPTVDIPDNVIVMLAITGPWNEGQPAVRDKYYTLLKDWTKKMNGCKIYMWNYTTKCGNMIANIPNFTPMAVASFYKNTAPYSFGAFMESETDYWILGFMNYYMYSKVMWDVNADPAAIMDEHCRLMYGTAAPQMREIFASLEKHWLNDIMSNIRETTIGPQAVLPSNYELWNRIYSQDETDRIEKQFDAAEAATAGDANALKRVKYIRSELWGHVIEGRKEYEKDNSDRSTWAIHASPAQSAITIDGKLDDASWKDAEQMYMIPRKGKEVEVHTRVKMLHDKDNFYIGIECDEPETDKMLCAKHDGETVDIWKDNLVELFFAANHQTDLMYQIMLSSEGKVADMVQAPGRSCDISWNSGLEYKAGEVPGKMWVAEVRIPRSSMPDITGNSFAVNFTRGRILNQGGCKVPYYVWCPFAKQLPEYCGTAVLGNKPESKSILKWFNIEGTNSGDKGRFFGPAGAGEKWFSRDKILKDEKCFMTGGSSLRLEATEHNLLRCYIPDLKPNTTYRLSFFYQVEDIKPKASNGGFFGIVRYACTGKTVVHSCFSQFPIGTITWQRHVSEFTTPEVIGNLGQPYMQFSLYNSESGCAWVDQVEIVPVEK